MKEKEKEYREKVIDRAKKLPLNKRDLSFYFFLQDSLIRRATIRILSFIGLFGFLVSLALLSKYCILILSFMGSFSLVLGLFTLSKMERNFFKRLEEILNRLEKKK